MEVGQLLHCDFNIEQLGLFGSLYGTSALLKFFWILYDHDRLLLISINPLCIAALICVLKSSIFCFVTMLKNGQ
jgi:hypothetical protein